MAGRGSARSLLTLGEAAELANVALLAMRTEIRAGRLPTRRGLHVGHEIDLVALDDLCRVFPSARGKRPTGASLASRGIEVEGPNEDEGEPDPLARELGHLRDQVRSAKEHNRRLFSQLGDTDTELRDLLERLHVDEDARVEFERRMAQGQRAIDEALDSLRRTRLWATASTLGLLLLLALQFMSWAQPGQSQASEGAPAGDAPGADGRSPLVAETPPGGDDARDRAPETPPVDDVDPRGAALQATTNSEPASQLADAQLADVHPGAGQPAAGQPGAAGQPSGAADAAARPAEPTEADPVATDVPAPGPGAPRASGPACTYHDLTRRGAELRDVLGPCLGPWNESTEVVVGAHRFDGAPYCQHHLLVARDLGGSIARARQVAEFAHAESLWPPLVQLRLDRSAAGFLRGEVSAWIESGFEGAVPEEHTWTAEAQPDCYALESWVRSAAEGDLARLRCFRLRIAVDDGPLGDRLLDFDWLE